MNDQQTRVNVRWDVRIDIAEEVFIPDKLRMQSARFTSRKKVGKNIEGKEIKGKCALGFVAPKPRM